MSTRCQQPVKACGSVARGGRIEEGMRSNLLTGHSWRLSDRACSQISSASSIVTADRCNKLRSGLWLVSTRFSSLAWRSCSTEQGAEAPAPILHSGHPAISPTFGGICQGIWYSSLSMSGLAHGDVMHALPWRTRTTRTTETSRLRWVSEPRSKLIARGAPADQQQVA